VPGQPTGSDDSTSRAMCYGSSMANDTYLFGRSAGELQRLAQQAALVEPETEELFLRSGIGAGMHVLEIGSGAVLT